MAMDYDGPEYDEPHTHPRKRKMPAPSVRPLNPDHQRLIDDLLANPATAMCPICGQRGFWDNREGKKNQKSPDWKCKNKACVGATPMKRKDPYAVWLPDGYASAPPAPSKRLQSPNDAPPAFHTEVPLPDDPDGAGEPGEPVDPDARKVAIKEDIETAYRFALDVATRAQLDNSSGNDALYPTPESIQAGAATILIQMERRGAI